MCTSALLFLALASSATCMVTRSAAQELCAWVNGMGGNARNVVVGPTRHGLGLLAAEVLKPGDVAVSIPSSCMLSTVRRRDSSALTELHDSVPEGFWSARLGLVLLAERSKGDTGALAPFIRTLPATFTVPLFWSPDAIKLLEYPTVQKNAVEAARFVSSFASERLGSQCADAFGGLTISADALGWAVAACSSRAFRVGGGERVLCPIIDLGNHAPAPQANCHVRGTLGDKVELVVTKEISLGEEVTYCYGSLSNDAFLLDYGFVPTEPPNAHDDVLLAWADGELLQTACATAGLKPSQLAPWQQSALRACVAPGLETVRVTRNGVDDDTMVACRI
eukprot:CAMPEP_0174707194 /NCGR_PEP_ID=MMETSP1094-20130205/9775_1 /TAXON_ID=156173 /ORGANISM="Chrysochromulina brevifilum, Strain UTEX LB 985" /LENGTH=335 /DNA_ID=CAMNT_0015905539 /DNA_START=16 /DNA_END=1021 /DNA_ORIENTATION=-